MLYLYICIYLSDFSSLYNLSIEDRYYIGKIACKSRKYNLCYTWMESVLSRHTNQSSINILDVMDHAINSLEKVCINFSSCCFNLQNNSLRDNLLFFTD